MLSGPPDDERPTHPLVGGGAPSPREMAVLRLVCEGLGNAEIAERLVVSRRTVQSHVANLMRKAGARTRTDLAVRAFRAGIVPLWPCACGGRADG